MVLSGLANSFRRLLSHIRQSSLSSCSRGEGHMEPQEGERAMQASTRYSSAASAALEENDGAMDRSPTESFPSGNVQSQHAALRMVPIKRKLEELELGAGILSASQARPRRETRDDLPEGTLPELSSSDRNCADSLNAVKVQSLEEESDLKEDGKSATDPDAMWDGEVPCSDAWPDDTRVLDDNKDLLTGRGVVRASDTGGDVAMPSTIEEGNISKSSSSSAVGKVESSAKEPLDHVDSLIEKAKEDFRALDSVDCKTSEAGRTGTDLNSLKEGDSSELETVVRRRPETGFDAGLQEIRTSITGSGSSSKGDFFCDDNFSSSGNGRRSHMLLQFFVRTYIDGRTIVLYGNAFDTVESVHRQIFLKTGLPLSEQRLIYYGRQLQHDQTLAECGVANDATLYLVARMRSTALPHSWQLINDLIATIRSTCAMEFEEGQARYKLMQAQRRIRSGVKDFLKMAMKSAPEHMQVFQLAGATSALVMLLLSPIESNRECAEQSIKLFFCTNEDCLPAHMHSHCAPVLLDFCKLLAKSAPSHSLYPVCRNALACLLDTVGAMNGGSYFHEAKAETIVGDFAPFVNELSISLCSNLRWTAMEYSIKEWSAHFPSYVKDGQDFTAFVTHLCKGMEACKGICVFGSSFSENEEYLSSLTHSRTVGTLNNADLRMGSLGSVDEVEAKDGAGLEIGSQRWLQWLFHELLQALDGCLAAIHQLTERPLEPSELAVADEKPFCWAPFLVVLKGLHTIAQLYEGAMEDLLVMLQTRRYALNLLIMQSRWQDDHSWVLDHKLLLNFESKRRLVMAMLPEPQDDHDERQEIVVRRSKVLSESFEALAYADPDTLQGGISLEFISEEATGPGVLREWFSLICREIFNPQNALFKSCPSDGRRVFPNPASGVNPGHLTYFRFCGRIIALSLMHRVQINVVFSLAFFKQLSGLPISWQDARDADPILYESCKKLLQMDAEDIDSDVLGLTFVCEDEQLGAMKTVELCPGGKDMSVNSKNRLIYVECLVRQRFVTSVTEQVRSFSQGFSELLATGNLEQFLRGLEAEDFDLILHGSGQVLCLEDWKLHTEYHEYNYSDDQIVWFWQVLEGMTNEQCRKLLFFSTSVTQLPVEGFAGLPSKFHIHKGHSDTTWLPTAHTCFFQLILPLYPSFEIMREKLLALTDGHITEGFGFA